MQNLKIPEKAESRIVPKWLFPSCFSDKDRITSSRPDIVLVTPTSAKTRKQQTTAGGWVLRSGRGQLRETGSTPAAPPATPNNPNPCSSLLFLCFCSDGSNQHKTWAAGGKSVFIREAGWEEPFGNNSTFGCFRKLEILHGHPFVAAYVLGDNA